MSVTVAVGQYASAGDVEADIATTVAAIEHAAGADLLVMPELFLGGYRLPPIVVGETDPRLSSIETAAAAAGLVALVGACLDGPDGFTISLLEFGRGTRRIYDKQNPCDDEKDHVVAGDDSVIIDVAGWNVGLSICYDGCFPEHARVLALAGAELYVASVAYFAGSVHRRELYYRARALENGMFVAVSGLTGAVAGQEFDGGSAIYDPEGRVLADVTGRGLAIATIDRPLLKATRARHTMLTDLREPAPRGTAVTHRLNDLYGRPRYAADAEDIDPAAVIACLLVLDGEEPVGTVSLRHLRDLVEIKRMYLVPATRGGGLAARLLAGIALRGPRIAVLRQGSPPVGGISSR